MTISYPSTVSRSIFRVHCSTIMKVLIIAFVLGFVAADNSYQRYHNDDQEPHSFNFEVKDGESYNDFSHNHNNDGKRTTGSYRVVLPDGRTQTVHYTSDSVNGYVVDVKYDGDAKYDEYRPSKTYTTYTKPAPVVYKTTTAAPVIVYQTTTPEPVVPTTPEPVVYTTPEAVYRRMKTYPAWFFNTNKA